MGINFGNSRSPAAAPKPTTEVSPSEGLYDMSTGKTVTLAGSPSASIGEWADTALDRFEPHGQAMIDGARNAYNNPGEALGAVADGVGHAIVQGAAKAWDNFTDRAVIAAGPYVMGQDRWNIAVGKQVLNLGDSYFDAYMAADELLTVYEEDGLAGLSGELAGKYGLTAAGSAAAGPLGGKLGALLKSVSMTAQGQKLKKLVDKVLGPKKKPKKKKDDDDKEKDTGAFIGKVSAARLVDDLIASGKLKVEAGQHAGAVRGRLIQIASTKTGYETLQRIADGKHTVTFGLYEGEGSASLSRFQYDRIGAHYTADSHDGNVRTAPIGPGGTNSAGGYRGPNGEWVDTSDAFNLPNAGPTDAPVLIAGPGTGTGGRVVVSLNDADNLWVHELGHAANASEGVGAGNLWSRNKSLDPTVIGQVHIEEWQNIGRTDNPFRSEVGDPLRLGHGHEPGAAKPPGPRDPWKE